MQPRTRSTRLAKIQAAKAELEAEAREQAEEQKAAAEARIAERREQEARTGKKTRGRVAVATGPTSGTRRQDHALPRSSPSSKPAADSRSRSASTSPLSCQGSPTHPSSDFQHSLPPPGPLAICNCQYGFA